MIFFKKIDNWLFFLRINGVICVILVMGVPDFYLAGG